MIELNHLTTEKKGDKQVLEVKMANDALLIANFYKTQLKGSVSSSSGGVQLPVNAGPESFVRVTTEAVGSLPWTLTMAHETSSTVTISKLPAIAAFSPPTGEPAKGYLTSVVYPASGSGSASVPGRAKRPEDAQD